LLSTSLGTYCFGSWIMKYPQTNTNRLEALLTSRAMEPTKVV
jgi:hypothetical protein